MIKDNYSTSKRTPKLEEIETGLVIAGGGMAGTCAAITAARQGVEVVLVQDRPVLGGNASSEIRLWILGATSHMGNNNRWSREGGIIDEILLENLYRNPEGNPLILDTILLEKVVQEKNIRLLLNTVVFDLEKKSPDEIDYLKAFCSQNSTEYKLKAPLFIDSSGDGIVGFMAGAAFRMGAEHPDEFQEKFAPDHQYGQLLGHSLYFYSKDTGKPVKFIPPSFALTDITRLPRFRSFNLRDHGCRLWWVEYGGRLDTIHQSEEIKFELWKVVYGIWNHLKNSGEYQEMENLTLEWVGTIPGKRESRRFEGDYMISQRDLVEQKHHYDAVAFGGWALDLHPADGVFGDQPGCNQWHMKGVYQIPYRCYYSKNIRNLFLAGRIISATHVAFGSSRVMATCAFGAQAVAVAASICLKNNWLPRDLSDKNRIGLLQQELLKTGHHIPGLVLEDPADLAKKAEIQVSSEFTLQELPFDGPWYKMEYPLAQILPLNPGKLSSIEISLQVKAATVLQYELRKSEKSGNFTPDRTIFSSELNLEPGERMVRLNLDYQVSEEGYYFLCLMKNELIEVKCSLSRVTGLLTVFKKFNKAVSNYGEQVPPDNIGIDRFEFWVPERRPSGHNLAFKFEQPVYTFNAKALTEGIYRPVDRPHAWVASPGENYAEIILNWSSEHTISKIYLHFDADFDHALESTLMGHPEREVPFCVRNYEILDSNENLIYSKSNNHYSLDIIVPEKPVVTNRLIIRMQKPVPEAPVALFGVRCY